MIYKQKGTNRGQLTLMNMIMIVITLVLYAVFAVPVLSPLITTATSKLQGNYCTDGAGATISCANEYTPVIVALIQLILLFLLLMILITGLNYALPRREGG